MIPCAPVRGSQPSILLPPHDSRPHPHTLSAQISPGCGKVMGGSPTAGLLSAMWSAPVFVKVLAGGIGFSVGMTTVDSAWTGWAMAHFFLLPFYFEGRAHATLVKYACRATPGRDALSSLRYVGRHFALEGEGSVHAVFASTTPRLMDVGPCSVWHDERDEAVSTPVPPPPQCRLHRHRHARRGQAVHDSKVLGGVCCVCVVVAGAQPAPSRDGGGGTPPFTRVPRLPGIDVGLPEGFG